MAETNKLTMLELNGVKYGLGKSIYAELDMSLERFVELLGRDFYCPTLSQSPSSSTITYTDTDGSVNTFQVGQPCRWKESGAWRLAVCADHTGSSATWHVLPTKVSELSNDAGYATGADLSEAVGKKQDKVLKFENKSASAWVSDTVYEDYPYRCDVSCAGVTATMYAEVVFSLEHSVSGQYAPLCETKEGVVSIWSKENTIITIPTIIITV